MPLQSGKDSFDETASLIGTQPRETPSGFRASILQFAVFAVAGGLSTVCHLVVLYALHDIAGLGVITATTWGATVGAIVNYALNRGITFSHSTPGSGAIARFAVVAAIGLGLNAAGMALLDSGVPHVHYLVRQCAVTSFVLIYSFSLNKLWTFRDMARG
jgi:putative flippase GtrA